MSTTPQTNDLDRVALLATLNITRWTGRKTDKRASNALTESSGAKDNAARVSKDLIPREPIVRINDAYNRAFRRFKHVTMPWSDDGRRLIPASVVMAFTNSMLKSEAEFFAEVQALSDEYDDLRTQAREELGELFDEADYPPASTITPRFSFSYSLEPVPTSGDIRVALPDSVRETLEQSIYNASTTRLAAATKDVYMRVHDAVERMVRVLSADKPRIFETLMDDIQLLVNVLPDLNITNDPQLTKLAKLMSTAFADVTSNDLRENQSLRVIKAAEAQGVLDTMSDMLR